MCKVFRKGVIHVGATFVIHICATVQTECSSISIKIHSTRRRTIFVVAVHIWVIILVITIRNCECLRKRAVVYMYVVSCNTTGPSANVSGVECSHHTIHSPQIFSYVSLEIAKRLIGTVGRMRPAWLSLCLSWFWLLTLYWLRPYNSHESIKWSAFGIVDMRNMSVFVCLRYGRHLTNLYYCGWMRE